MLLSSDQLNTIFSLINKNTAMFVGTTMGGRFLSDEDKKILRNSNVDYAKLYDQSKDLVLLNYHLGILSNAIGDANTKNVSYKELTKFIAAGEYVSLSKVEKATIDNIKSQSLSDIRSHNGKIFKDINNVVVNEFSSSRANQEKFLSEQIQQGVASRKSRKQIARDIARLTGDWSRNFNKSVEYISHTALNEGRAAMIERRFERGNKQAMVYFQVQPDACPNCKRLYLKSGSNEPMVFNLDEIQSNGSNIGRKQKDWKATQSAIHPHCRCLLTEHIKGTEWNGSAFSFPENYKPGQNRKKVRIVFNGKEHYV